MSQENVEVVKAGIDAWNAGDMDTWSSFLAPDVTWCPTPDWPEPGPYVVARRSCSKRGNCAKRRTATQWNPSPIFFTRGIAWSCGSSGVAKPRA